MMVGPPQLVTGAELGREVLGSVEEYVVLGPGRAASVGVSSCVSVAYHRVSVVLSVTVSKKRWCVLGVGQQTRVVA